MIKFKKLKLEGKAPERADIGAAGYDLFSAVKTQIEPKTWKLIDTGIALEIPINQVGLIWPRSGLALKKGLDVFAGVIDSSYRGSIGVILFNASYDIIFIEPGDKIAQIIFQRYETHEMKEVEELSDTIRGEGGFGSTDR